MAMIQSLNFAIALIFFLCYAYQFVYVAVPWLVKPKPHKPTKAHRFAVLISARNEAAVIRQLIDSIHAQTYDASLVTIFVMADNCTDGTAQIAREAGAVVYKRQNRKLIGKGYALNELMQHINADYPDRPFDAFFVFDADNVLDPHYIEAMNRTFSDGYRIITSYRNSKNYGTNWISAGYALWFLRESRYLNHARMLLNTSCAVSGTGFLFSREVIEETGGWHFFLLTEDIEFTVSSVIHGEKIGFCTDAVLYDEQPTTFRQSWKQRLRWAKGFLHVFRDYGGGLIEKCLSGSFSAYDMSMTTMPAMFLSLAGMALNCGTVLIGLLSGNEEMVRMGALLLAETFCMIYLTTFLLGLVTTISEWKQIHTSTAKKLRAMFTFPLFMMTYIPIAFVSLFKKVEWSPIVHSEAKTVAEICSGKHK